MRSLLCDPILRRDIHTGIHLSINFPSLLPWLILQEVALQLVIQTDQVLPEGVNSVRIRERRIQVGLSAGLLRP